MKFNTWPCAHSANIAAFWHHFNTQWRVSRKTMLRTCRKKQIRLQNKDDIYRGERHSLPTQKMDLYPAPILAQGLLRRNLFNCAVNDDVDTEGHQTPASDTGDIIKAVKKNVFSLSESHPEDSLSKRLFAGPGVCCVMTLTGKFCILLWLRPCLSKMSGSPPCGDTEQSFCFSLVILILMRIYFFSKSQRPDHRVLQTET